MCLDPGGVGRRVGVDKGRGGGIWNLVGERQREKEKEGKKKKARTNYNRCLFFCLPLFVSCNTDLAKNTVL